jgi:hypothetical protein
MSRAPADPAATLASYGDGLAQLAAALGRIADIRRIREIHHL